MTTAEKVAMAAGSDLWHTTPVPRLGVPRLKLSDGPSGVRGAGYSSSRSASFPCGTALAATWNPDLVARVGRALAEEARSKGVHVLLGPNVNLHRSPLGGRSFECFSEDPHLSARLAVAYIRGVQEGGVAATVKHFVCNDTEFERFSISSEVDERTLREIYLPPFEAAIREGGAWALMAAYNRLNGVHCCEHPLLTSLLRTEWGFDGVVMSDWWATRSTAAAASAGLDLEMPGPPQHMGEDLLEAVRSGEVPEELLDQKARRLLRLAVRTGALDETDEPDEQSPDRPEHRSLARQAAAESIVLLKNAGGVLPLAASGLRKLAVVGLNAEVPATQGGGSAHVSSHPAPSPLAAIRAACPGAAVGFEPGCSAGVACPPLDQRLLDGPIRLEHFGGTAPAGEPVLTCDAPNGRLRWVGSPVPGLEGGGFALRGTGRVRPHVSGVHTFSIAGTGPSRLYLDGRLLVDDWDDWSRSFTSMDLMGEEVRADASLVAGQPYDVTFELVAGPSPVTGVRVGCAPPAPPDVLERAVRLAAESDAAVVVVGTDEDWEKEGADRPDMRLPGSQAELVHRVAEANPLTVVVVNAGSPVEMDWADRVPAVLQSWFGGEEGGAALAEVIFGRVNPSGRLPTTIPRRLEDNPTYPYPPAEGGRMPYTEGIFVGYRHYDRTGVEPRFCFGHGLSYTPFRYGPLQLERTQVTAGEPLAVWLDVANAGRRGGFEVVQLYVRDVESSLPRPDRELRAFAKVWIEPGRTERVRLDLSPRSFAFWDPERSGWVAEPGGFELLAGSSSRDIRASARVTLV
jgi:beta-glucosidase